MVKTLSSSQGEMAIPSEIFNQTGSQGARSKQFISEAEAIIAKHIADLKFASVEFDALWRETFDQIKFPTDKHKSSSVRSAVCTAVSDMDVYTAPLGYPLPLDVVNALMDSEEQYEGWLQASAWGMKSRQFDFAAYALRRALRLRKGLGEKFLMVMLRLMRQTGQRWATLWCATQLMSKGLYEGEVLTAFAEASEILPLGPALTLLSMLHAQVPESLPLCFALAERRAANGEYTAAEKLILGGDATIRQSMRWTQLILSLDMAAGRQTDVPDGLDAILHARDASATGCIALGRALREASPMQSERCHARAIVLAEDMPSRLEILTELSHFPAPEVEQVRLPLMMISQVQRSGGTLLSQLLDGHPQILAHPHEIHVGYPRKWYWPDLDIGEQPGEWLNQLFELPLVELALNGYGKPDGNVQADKVRHHFDIRFGTLVARFYKLLSDRPAMNQRDVLDAYFDAFFTSWSGLERSGNERWISGFTPRMLSQFGSMERYWRDYPDGFVISLVRNPLTWYVSSQRHNAEYSQIEHAIEMWKTSTLSAISQLEHNAARFHLTTYEALVGDTETEMRVIARRLGIDFVPSLLEPTFMGRAMLPNSSFEIATTGVHRSSLHTENLLAPAQRRYIELETADLYCAAVTLADARRAEFISECR